LISAAQPEPVEVPVL